MLEPVRSDSERELKMRCIEAAVRSPFSNSESVQSIAQEWFDWILLPPAPPRGRTSSARSKMEAQKKK